MSEQVRRMYQAGNEPTPAATPSNMGDRSILEGFVSSELYFAQQDWSQWYLNAEAAANLYQQDWMIVLSEPLGEQHWSQPGQQLVSPGQGSVTNPIIWPSQPEECILQQETLPYLVGDYDTDSWSAAIPLTLPLTPTWNQSQVQRAHITHDIHAATESPATDPVAASAATYLAAPFAAPAGQNTQEPLILRSPPHSAGTGGIPEVPWFWGLAAMGTTPLQDESKSDGAERPPGKRTRPENPGSTSADRQSLAPRKKNYCVRNRAAAKRCRDKSRQFELDLAAREKQVTEDHMHLEASAAALREEVLALKNEILLHGDCNCAMMQTYISNAAKHVINTPAYQQGLR